MQPIYFRPDPVEGTYDIPNLLVLVRLVSSDTVALANFHPTRCLMRMRL